MAYQLPRYLLFDLDGTVLDSLPGITFSVNEACRKAGLPELTVDLRTLIGPPMRTILSKVVPSAGTTLLDELESNFRLTYDLVGWKRTACFKGTREVLTSMKSAGHRLFVVSNKPRHISLRILEHEGVLNLFERIYTRDTRVPPYSSKEEMIREIMHEYNVPPSSCMLVGDTMDDVEASTASGIGLAFMEHGYGEAPADLPVQLRLQGFSDFSPYLKKENVE